MIRRSLPLRAGGRLRRPGPGAADGRGVRHLPAVAPHRVIQSVAMPASGRSPRATVRRQDRRPCARPQAAGRHHHELARRSVRRLRPRAVRRGARDDGAADAGDLLRQAAARLPRDLSSAARRRNRRPGAADGRLPQHPHDRRRAGGHRRAAVRSLRLRVAPGHRAPGRRGDHGAGAAGLRRLDRRLRRGAGRLRHEAGCPRAARRRSQTRGVRSCAAVRPQAPGSRAAAPGAIPPAGARPGGQIHAMQAGRGSCRDHPSRARCGERPPWGHRRAGPAAASRGAVGRVAGRRLGSVRRRANRQGRPRGLFRPTYAVRRRAVG